MVIKNTKIKIRLSTGNLKCDNGVRLGVRGFVLNGAPFRIKTANSYVIEISL